MKIQRIIRPVTEQEKDDWNTLAAHPLQSWAWGEFRESMGVDVVRLGAFENDVLKEIWQLTFHSIPHTRFTIGYFPKGPLPTEEMILALTKLGKEKNTVHIQLEPNVQLTAVSRQLTAHLIPSHHPMFTKHTFILDLTKSEADLLASMHSKTRYNLKIAQKHEVTIREDNSLEGFAAYQKLTEETTKRQGFFAHNNTYHKKMWEILHKAGIAHIFTATYSGEVLAAWVLFTWGKTIYYPYGASSRSHREVMAPQLLLWEIVKWGKANSFTSFDLWGALGPNPDPEDPWYGFHRFKEGFKPELIEYIGSFDLVIKPFLYQCYKLLDTVRWFMLKKSH